MNRIFRPNAAVLAAVSIALICPRPGAAETPATTELSEIERAHAAYGAAWLANEPQAVLATLAEDVVLMPAGLAPVRGHAAAEAFWWPDDGSTTTITAYETSIDDLRHTGDLAVVRAHSRMAFTWEKDGQTTEQTNHSMSLTVLERGPDGRWRITQRMWGRTP